MEERGNNLDSELKRIVPLFLEKSKDKEIQLISHFDTDGITSAAIMVQALRKLDVRFTLKIVKSLDEDFIRSLSRNKVTLFLDLASGSFKHIEEHGLNDVFIVDHHEISDEIPANVEIINSELYPNKQKISGAGLTYFFCKEIDKENARHAKLAVLGMIGDRMEKEVGILNNSILEDGEIKRKRGLLVYPSTRPLNRTLEFSSNPYIPGVSGDIKGVLELLRESGLTPENGKYKSLLELTDEEMKKLVTSVMLRSPASKEEDILGDIFLIKLYNQLEDARELSAKINACSRYGEPETAIQMCMEVPSAKKRAESIHSKYKQELIAGIRAAKELEKVEGPGYIILNARHEIKDTMIGTISSILAGSHEYKPETVLIGMAYYENKVKISSRIVGRSGRNLRELLHKIIHPMGGDVGGHAGAAGGIITQDQEEEFLDTLKKHLEIEMVKV